jgi:hypothetical protein
MIFVYVAVGIVVLVSAFLAWGVARLRKKNAQVTKLMRHLRIGDLNHLLAEANERLSKCYGVTIDLKNRDERVTGNLGLRSRCPLPPQPSRCGLFALKF